MVNTLEGYGINMKQVAALLKAKPRDSEIHLTKTSVSGYITESHWTSLANNNHSVVHVFKNKTSDATLKVKVYRNDK